MYIYIHKYVYIYVYIERETCSPMANATHLSLRSASALIIEATSGCDLWRACVVGLTPDTGAQEAQPRPFKDMEEKNALPNFMVKR
jgi:hypothetical protein